ncbi:hypothetical protein [Streptomyces nodosus]|uniref:hypothetical protein n=1 Tax=Streptomyces nodosus TaxID=40318 RepID=UPI0038115B81
MPVITHLAAVWFIGSALTALQFYAVILAGFSGSTAALVITLAVMVPLAVYAFVCLGAAARSIVPLTRRARGLWGWASGVYGLGTAGLVGTVMVDEQTGRALVASGPLFYLCGGIWYALKAAFFLPGVRARLTALGAAIVLAAGGTYAAWDAAQPPTLDEWITANGVDRALLRVGDPPSGYTLGSMGAGEGGFGATYEGSGSAGLHLGVARAGHDTRRADTRGCPVPFGEPIHCTDDGGGRLLVNHEGDDEYRELILRRAGLVYTVTVRGTGDAELTAARHILSGLRPASDEELATLVSLPMRR